MLRTAEVQHREYLRRQRHLSAVRRRWSGVLRQQRLRDGLYLPEREVCGVWTPEPALLQRKSLHR
jgi:hypothetical protein